jgi:hypothetical protein
MDTVTTAPTPTPWPAPHIDDLVTTLTVDEAAIGDEAFKDDVTIVEVEA